jgi:hypothetical protein
MRKKTAILNFCTECFQHFLPLLFSPIPGTQVGRNLRNHEYDEFEMVQTYVDPDTPTEQN